MTQINIGVNRININQGTWQYAAISCVSKMFQNHKFSHTVTRDVSFEII